MHIFDELKERGLVFQTTDEEALRKALAEGNVSFYSGYDPTADSLHLVHLVPSLVMKHLQLAGHKPYHVFLTLKMATTKLKWSTTTTGSLVLALLTFYAMLENISLSTT